MKKQTGTLKKRSIVALAFTFLFSHHLSAQLEDTRQFVSLGYVNAKGNMAATDWVDSSRSNLGLTDGLHVGFRIETDEEKWYGAFVEAGFNFHLNKRKFRENWATQYDPNTPVDNWSLTSPGAFLMDFGAGLNINARISENLCIKPFVSVGYGGGSLPHLKLRNKSDLDIRYEEDYGNYNGFSLGWGLHNNFKIFDTWVSLSYAGKTIFSESKHTMNEPLLNNTIEKWRFHFFSYQEIKLALDLADLIL